MILKLIVQMLAVYEKILDGLSNEKREILMDR